MIFMFALWWARFLSQDYWYRVIDPWKYIIWLDNSKVLTIWFCLYTFWIHIKICQYSAGIFSWGWGLPRKGHVTLSPLLTYLTRCMPSTVYLRQMRWMRYRTSPTWQHLLPRFYSIHFTWLFIMYALWWRGLVGVVLCVLIITIHISGGIPHISWGILELF